MKDDFPRYTLRISQILLDKLAKHNIVHKNKAGNLKSSLQMHVNAL